MKLDRNIAENRGEGKYALVSLRKVRSFPPSSITAKEVRAAMIVLESHGVLERGMAESESEFFVLKLKDEFSFAALKAYANAAEDTDFEYALKNKRPVSENLALAMGYKRLIVFANNGKRKP